MLSSGLLRHQTPSINALQCFEAAARHLSFTLAAQELHLTQSAVSKQVAQLESTLQTPLFSRVRKRLTLSPAGVRYLAHTQRILQSVEQATLEMLSHNQETEALTIGAHPSFGAYWLIPYLSGFYHSHPHIELQFVDLLQPRERIHTHCDAAFLFGQGNWEGVHAMKLFDEGMIAVCHPDTVAQKPNPSIQELKSMTLIQCSSRPSAWHQYFLEQDLAPTSSYHGPRFDTWSACIQAALNRYGVALVPHFLAAPALATGRLVRPWKYELANQGSYYLTYAEHEANEPALRQFIHWVSQNPYLKPKDHEKKE
ncbi:MAG TPA: LysR family transcriptional regulator [Alcaligenaceae bacterium]|nr:LysR family transcriptional regulator [Alcaligenaceae bacterium]